MWRGGMKHARVRNEIPPKGNEKCPGQGMKNIEGRNEKMWRGGMKNVRVRSEISPKGNEKCAGQGMKNVEERNEKCKGKE
jgi:hypothetical protein